MGVLLQVVKIYVCVVDVEGIGSLACIEIVDVEPNCVVPLVGVPDGKDLVVVVAEVVAAFVSVVVEPIEV